MVSTLPPLNPMAAAYVVQDESGDCTYPIAVFRSLDAAERYVAEQEAAAKNAHDWDAQCAAEIQTRLARGLKRGLIFPGPALMTEIENAIGPRPIEARELAVYEVPMEIEA